LGVLVEPRLKASKAKKNVAAVANAEIKIKDLGTALYLYKLDNGGFPTTEQGLQALVSMPTSGKIPQHYRPGGYLETKTVPRDPWGNEYWYFSPGEYGDYDLYSCGADGVRGGIGFNKDIESWNLK
jgi:general secretion pathway protein G